METTNPKMSPTTKLRSNVDSTCFSFEGTKHIPKNAKKKTETPIKKVPNKRIEIHPLVSYFYFEFLIVLSLPQIKTL